MVYLGVARAQVDMKKGPVSSLRYSLLSYGLMHFIH